MRCGSTTCSDPRDPRRGGRRGRARSAPPPPRALLLALLFALGFGGSLLPTGAARAQDAHGQDADRGAAGAAGEAADPAAARCGREMRAPLHSGRARFHREPGVVAAEMMQRAVQLAEPAMPPLHPSAASTDATPHGFLLRRGLLPPGWRPEALDRDTWQAMLDAFTSGYHAERVEAAEPDSADVLYADARQALERVAEALRPALLLASDGDDPQRLSFAALVWNWTPYPRLILLRVPAGLDLSGGVEPVLEAFGTCALHLRGYLLGDEESARKLFLANADTGIRVLASLPPRDTWPWPVPAGEEAAVLGLEHPRLAGLEVVSVAFEGPAPGALNLLTVLSRLDTNLSLYDLNHHLAFP